jgi:hypothetical protein
MRGDRQLFGTEETVTEQLRAGGSATVDRQETIAISFKGLALESRTSSVDPNSGSPVLLQPATRLV